jgi:hypothetical protein
MRFAMLLLLLLVWRLGADDGVAERAGSAGEGGKATKEVPFRNSLGMEFVPVKGAAGLLWSRWETRVQDYAVFCKETGREHEGPDFPQGADHPVVSRVPRSTSGYRLAPLGGVRGFLMGTN